MEGGPIFSSGELKSLLARYDDCVSLSEVDSYARILDGKDQIIETLFMATSIGKRAEGHTLGASFDRLNMLAAAGISSCHESVRDTDVRDRVRLGLATMVRQVLSGATC